MHASNLPLLFLPYPSSRCPVGHDNGFPTSLLSDYAITGAASTHTIIERVHTRRIILCCSRRISNNRIFFLLPISVRTGATTSIVRPSAEHHISGESHKPRPSSRQLPRSRVSKTMGNMVTRTMWLPRGVLLWLSWPFDPCLFLSQTCANPVTHSF